MVFALLIVLCFVFLFVFLGWRLFLNERNMILDALEGSQKKTVLLSGDLHFAVVVQVRPSLVEFSVSPISSTVGFEKFWKKKKQTKEKVLFKSEFKNHLGRVDVKGENVSVEVWSELPFLGTKLQYRMDL